VIASDDCNADTAPSTDANDAIEPNDHRFD